MMPHGMTLREYAQAVASLEATGGHYLNPPLAEANAAQAASHVHNANVRHQGAIRAAGVAKLEALYLDERGSFHSERAESAYERERALLDATYQAACMATERAWLAVVAATREGA